MHRQTQRPSGPKRLMRMAAKPLHATVLACSGWTAAMAICTSATATAASVASDASSTSFNATSQTSVSAKANLKAASNCFDAAGLQQLQAATAPPARPTLIYLWSPRMVYAVTGATNAQQAAQQLGLDFVPLLDARISRAERLAALQSPAAQTLPASLRASMTQSATLCHNDLLGADATLHWPSSFVVQSGQVASPAIRGAMPLAYWREAIQSRLLPVVSKPNQDAVPTALHTAAHHVTANIQPQTTRDHSQDQACIAPNQFAVLPAALAGTAVDAYGNTQVSIGSYERISPDGRFVLRSFSGAQLGQVSLVELDASNAQQSARVTRIVATRLRNEAFPVQGTWRYLIDINGDHYRFADILQNPDTARPLFNAGMNGFYAAAAEVSTHSSVKADVTLNPEADTVQIRSLSWPTGNAEADSQGQGSLMSRTITVDTHTDRILHDSGTQYHCRNRSRIDGNQYALPMISVDGTEFAALPQNPVEGSPHIRVFGFGRDGAQCIPQAQFPSVAGKAIFGFSTSQTPADLVYEYRGQVWLYLRHLGRAINLAPWEDANSPVRRISASAFPGMTRDGRVIYAATWQQCQGDQCTPQSGYVITDPYQSNAYRQTVQNGHQSTKACITQQDVTRERNAFASFHGLAP